MGSRGRMRFSDTPAQGREAAARARRAAGVLVMAGLALTAAAALLGAPGIGSAWATMEGADPCQPRPGMLTPEDRQAMQAIVFERLKERVGLADAQAEAIRATLAAQREIRRRDRLELCQAGVDLRRLLAAADTDPAQVRAAGERLKAARARMLDRRLETSLALRSTLTPDQWARWIEVRKHLGRRGHRGHRSLAM